MYFHMTNYVIYINFVIWHSRFSTPTTRICWVKLINRTDALVWVFWFIIFFLGSPSLDLYFQIDGKRASILRNDILISSSNIGGGGVAYNNGIWKMKPIQGFGLDHRLTFLGKAQAAAELDAAARVRATDRMSVLEKQVGGSFLFFFSWFLTVFGQKKLWAGMKDWLSILTNNEPPLSSLLFLNLWVHSLIIVVCLSFRFFS